MKYSKLKGYKYKLEEDVIVQLKFISGTIDHPFVTLDALSLLTIKKGYTWDGASFITFDTKSSMKSSLVHDALYQMMREGLLSRDYRNYVDELLRDISIEEGMWKWRANLWYRVVQKYAFKSSISRKNPRNKVIEI